MLDLARTIPDPAVDVTYCFYACEEVSRNDSGLLELWEQRPDLLAADAAVLGEPTSCLVEAGCQGTLRVLVRMTGVRAHPARPFAGRNAIHRLAPVLATVAGWESRKVVLDGCEYAEQLQVLGVSGGVAGNVVPDEATATINFRFAPDRSTEDAQLYVWELLTPHINDALGDSLHVLDVAAGAPPALDHPLLAGLVAATGDAPRAKVGWTDVAFFWEHGVPAANFGPGDPLLAHHPDERVDRGALECARTVLTGLLTGEAAQR
jgi:succinyl-diaminopimelate desuccinylase